MQCSPASSYSEAQHVNPIDRSVVGIFARWWRLGILALARLALGRSAYRGQLAYSVGAGGPKSRSLAGKIQQ
jgi:hypothetical protein